MKNMFKRYMTVWAVFVVVFNVIIFAAPNELAGMTKTGGAFWSSYIMIMLMFVFQLVCAGRAFRESDMERFFLKMPLITISYVALILSVIAGAVCMMIPDLPNWVGVIVCALLLGYNIAAVLKAEAASDVILNVEIKAADKTAFMKQLKAEAEILNNRSLAPEIKGSVKKVCEAIKYSDPVSDVSLADAELAMKEKFDKFAKMADSGNFNDELQAMQSELISMIDDRNRRCKVAK